MTDPIISYTGNFEDVLLNRCFRDVADGFYVDIGAHHPTNASVTRLFYDRGWTGINIEPGEGIVALRSDRPRDINLEVAVSDFEGNTTFWVHSANPGTSTMASDVPEVVSEKAGAVKPQRVVVTTLNKVLETNALGRHIHFLKIDAEGAENAIVCSTDWDRHRPEVIVIESTEPYTNIRRIEPWQNVLSKSRYQLAYFDGVNDFWIRDESARLKDFFAIPVNVLDGFKLYDPELNGLRAYVASLSRQSAAKAPSIASAIPLKSLPRRLVRRVRSMGGRVLRRVGLLS